MPSVPDETLLGVAVPSGCAHRWERFAVRGGCQCGSPHCAEPLTRMLECANCDAEVLATEPGFGVLWEAAS